MRISKLLAAAGIALVAGIAGVANAGPLPLYASDPVHSVSSILGADVIQVRSAKRPIERREVANPEDELVGYADDGAGSGNGDELIGRVEPRHSNGGGEQALKIIGAFLGGGNANYYQPQQNAYANSIYGQCPVDFRGQPDGNCVRYINRQIAANNAARRTVAYKCPSASGIAIISRNYREGCMPVDQAGRYQSDDFGDY
jgi:hypothetical protein